ncbi:MAG: Bro-N domain-containing protein [Ruminococcus sp.]|nr:Bro-N domain-containing protein [Ruminococcus sp.]
MNEIQIFTHEQFGEIRIIKIDGQIYFVGVDMARALGYKNTRDALKQHVDKDDVVKRYPISDSLGRIQKTTIINESGLYSLVLASKLKGAKDFKHWVTSEVLPEIRKTGGYGYQKCLDCCVSEKLDYINANINSLRTVFCC